MCCCIKPPENCIKPPESCIKPPERYFSDKTISCMKETFLSTLSIAVILGISLGINCLFFQSTVATKGIITGSFASICREYYQNWTRFCCLN